MDTIIIRYKDNGLVHYDGKEYVESLSKVVSCSQTAFTRKAVWLCETISKVRRE